MDPDKFINLVGLFAAFIIVANFMLVRAGVPGWTLMMIEGPLGVMFGMWLRSRR